VVGILKGRRGIRRGWPLKSFRRVSHFLIISVAWQLEDDSRAAPRYILFSKLHFYFVLIFNQTSGVDLLRAGLKIASTCEISKRLAWIRIWTVSFKKFLVFCSFNWEIPGEKTQQSL
jgi:hypothetical protein